MSKLEELTRSLIAYTIPLLKHEYGEIEKDPSSRNMAERVRVIKALNTIEAIQSLLNNNKPPEKWSQLPLPLK